ncbi:MAG: hypothetical protein E6H06_01640 [Bacteroidetes bacterium]|nr:MAG: hypothetical protein E6H06_01640 [Bacteroidota bacterium]
MKKIRIMQAAILLAFVAVLAGCGPSREYSYYPRRNSASFSLIVNPGPGIYVNRYSDGRYYYRSPEGYMYWRGYDNRYYLDRSYLGRVQYDRDQYREWNRSYSRHGKRYRY